MTRSAHLFACAALLLSTPGWTQDDDGMEVFAEVDPYTEGDPAKLEALGYVAVGTFGWRGDLRTEDVRQVIGDSEVLWVETEHFRIGSTLTSYKFLADRDEKDRFKGEFKQLKEKLGRFKAPKKAIDPWLRLHLYAMRLENLVDEFERDFGLEPGDYEDVGPYLGQNHKQLVLLCQRDSELGRYVKDAYGHEARYTWRQGWGLKEGMFFGASYEAIQQSWSGVNDVIPFDSILYTRVVSGVTANLIDGYRTNQYSVPRWLSAGLCYEYLRRADPRWSVMFGQHGSMSKDDEWEWEPRVSGLVRNDFFLSADKMFAVTDYESLKVRDHLICWSKVEHLLEELEGDRAAFLNALCVQGGTSPPPAATQASALEAHIGITTKEWDEAWARWVKRNYAKR